MGETHIDGIPVKIMIFFDFDISYEFNNFVFEWFINQVILYSQMRRRKCTSITALMNFFKKLWMLGRGFSKKIYHAWKFGDSSFCSFWEKGLIWRKKTISDTHDWLLILDYFYTDHLPLDEASGWSRLHFLLFLRRATHEVIHYTVNWATVYWGFIKVLNTEGVLAVFVIS